MNNNDTFKWCLIESGTITTMGTIDSLSDEVLLKIASYLPCLGDRLSLAAVNERFQEICNDKSLLRHFRVRHTDNLSSATIAQAVKRVGKYIRYLDFANCYWMSTACIRKSIAKCHSIVQLDLRNCCPNTFTPELLDGILSSTACSASLRHLAVTDGGDFMLRPGEVLEDNDTSYMYTMRESSVTTLQQLESLHLTVGSKCTKGMNVLRLCSVKVMSVSVYTTSHNSRYCICHVCPLSLGLPMTQLWLSTNIVKEHNRLHNNLQRLRCCNFEAGRTRQNLASILHIVTVDNESSKPCLLSLGASSLPEGFINEKYDCCKLRCFSSGHFSLTRCFSIHTLETVLNKFTSLTSFCASLQFCFQETWQWIRPFLLMCSHLQQLNLLFSCDHDQSTGQRFPPMAHDMSHLANEMTKHLGKDLVSLALPTCFIVKVADSSPESNHTGMSNGGLDMTDFGKRQRVGISTDMSSSLDVSKALQEARVGYLQQFVSACPNMETLELMTYNLGISHLFMYSCWIGGHFLPRICIDVKTPRSRCSAELSVKDNDIVCISQWKCLKSLTLVGLPGIQHGQSLVVIVKECQQLRRLSLAYLGLDAGCVYMKALCEALKYATNLQDLRLQQPNLRVNQTLCQAIQHCSNLNRLCIIAIKTEFSHDGILGIFKRCKKLHVLHLITGSTLAACQRLTKVLVTRYKDERPALNVYIKTQEKAFSSSDMVKRIPWVHLSELTYITSRVCEKPVGWKGLDP